MVYFQRVHWLVSAAKSALDVAAAPYCLQRDSTIIIIKKLTLDLGYLFNNEIKICIENAQLAYSQVLHRMAARQFVSAHGALSQTEMTHLLGIFIRGRACSNPPSAEAGNLLLGGSILEDAPHLIKTLQAKPAFGQPPVYLISVASGDLH